jgi:hypothetical protein
VVTTQLANIMPGATAFAQLSYAAATVAFLVYAAGFVASFHLPEPQEKTMQE